MLSLSGQVAWDRMGEGIMGERGAGSLASGVEQLVSALPVQSLLVSATKMPLYGG